MKQLLPKIIGLYVNTICIFSPGRAARMALNIFATPRNRIVTDRQKDFLNSADRKTLKYQDLDIMTYNWSGPGKTVLLVHGWESNAARWKALVKLFQRESYNVVALDAPAHGSSGGKMFNALLYSEFIQVVARYYDPDVIVGHSVGGMASIFYAHREMNPKLNKLVLLGAPAHFEGVLERYVDLMGYTRAVYRAISKKVVEGYGHGPEYFSAAEFSKKLSCTILLIHDEDDKVIPYEDALLYKEKINKLEFISTNGLGHGLKDKSVFNKVLEFAEK